MNESYQTLDRQRKALLKKIAAVGPFIMATPAWLEVRCGRATCECARDRKKRHEKLHLSWTEAKNKSGTLYVPVDLHKEVLEWVENYWVVKALIGEMTELSRKMIRLYVKTRKRQGKRK